MSVKETHVPDCLNKIRLIVAVNTGNKVRDILPRTDLIQDLGLTLSIDLPEIISILNLEFHQEELNLNTTEVIAELEATRPTVLELAKLVQEVIDLG